jgi:hypothetical protein
VRQTYRSQNGTRVVRLHTHLFECESPVALSDFGSGPCVTRRRQFWKCRAPGDAYYVGPGGWAVTEPGRTAT